MWQTSFIDDIFLWNDCVYVLRLYATWHHIYVILLYHLRSIEAIQINNINMAVEFNHFFQVRSFSDKNNWCTSICMIELLLWETTTSCWSIVDNVNLTLFISSPIIWLFISIYTLYKNFHLNISWKKSIESKIKAILL
jgi:hypothetical protein